MKLIVGLGNPEEEHEKNRHNVGFMVVEEFARRKTFDQWTSVGKAKSETVRIRGEIILAKPQNYMNASGDSVKKLLDHFKINVPNLWVIYDDLDIALGDYKIQKGKSPRKHNGIKSVEKELGTKDFTHIRIGIDNRKSELTAANNKKITGERYVLQDFREKEMATITVVINEVVDEIIKMISDQIK